MISRRGMLLETGKHAAEQWRKEGSRKIRRILGPVLEWCSVFKSRSLLELIDLSKFN